MPLAISSENRDRSHTGSFDPTFDQSGINRHKTSIKLASRFQAEKGPKWWNLHLAVIRGISPMLHDY
jgi:hypothetical protein